MLAKLLYLKPIRINCEDNVERFFEEKVIVHFRLRLLRRIHILGMISPVTLVVGNSYVLTDVTT